MRKLDVFDKPMNGLYSHSVKGGILTIITICLSLLGSSCATFYFQQPNNQYILGETKSIHNTVLMNVDIVIYDRDCDSLTFHFDSTETLSPESIHIEKSIYTPSSTTQQSNKACRIHGNALIYPGTGNFHITPNDKDYTLGGQHRHLTKVDRQQSFRYSINDVYFGSDFSSNQHVLKNMQNIDSTSIASHTTYDIKVYPVEMKGNENAFVYSATRFELDKTSETSSTAYTGLYLKYAFQPTSLSFQNNQYPQYQISLCFICCFGSLYTIFDLICKCIFKNKLVSKRD